MAAVMLPPGSLRDHFKPASSESIRNGSYPAAYEDSMQQASGGFRPPAGSPAPTMPALQSYGGYGSLERPGSYDPGNLPIGSQGSLPIGSYGSRDRHESGGYGSLERPGSYEARNSPIASSQVVPGSHGSRDRHGTGGYGSNYEAAHGSRDRDRHGTGNYDPRSYSAVQTEYDHDAIRSYPSGNLPTSGGHLPGDGPINSSHFHKPGSHGSDQTLHAGITNIPDTVHGLHGQYPGHSHSPPTATQQYGYGSPHASPLGTVHGLHSQETLQGLHSRPTAHGLHPSYPGAPGSAQSLQSHGTLHDLHPAYKPGMGYSPPASQQLLPMGQMQHQDHQFSGQVMGKLRVRVIAAYNLKNTDLGVVPGEVSDPFCVIRLGKQEHTTDVVRNNLNPVFHSPNFEFDVDDEDAHVKIEIFNASQFYAHDSLGKVQIPINGLVPCEVHPRRETFHEGQGQVEVELTYIPPERMMESFNQGSMTRQGFAGVAAMPQMVGEHKKVQHKVPLPNWNNCGPEAFAAPPPEMDHALVGEERRKMEYDTWACHLGQYDYQKGGPVYFPRARPTDEDDRHRWKEDPFHDWRNDHNNMEVGGKMQGAIMKHQTRENKDAFHKWIKDKPARPEQHKWKNDPFDGWLRSDKKHAPEGGNEKLQEAKMKRHQMHLPSFSEMDAKRFEDHREYCNLQDHVAPRSRVNEQMMIHDKEHSWKNDAFYGWLPGRGHEYQRHEMLMDHQPQLHRPLEAARMKRLPSFSDDKFLGLRGKGLGVLKVNVMKAENLEYDAKQYQGRPSACVKLAMLSDGTKHQQKCTATIERTPNPVYNTGMFQFEIPSQQAELRLRVVDILVQPTAFLGEIIMPVAQLMRSETPKAFVEQLQGTQSRYGSSKIYFEACYVPYAGEGNWQPTRSMQMKSIEGHDPRERDPYGQKAQSRSRPESSHSLKNQHRTQSHASHASSGQGSHLPEGISIARITMKVIRANNLEDKAFNSWVDGKSDPYVKVTLKQEGVRDQKHKTRTIDDNLDPEWNEEFQFEITNPEWHTSELICQVYSEKSNVQKLTTKDDLPLGHCRIPVALVERIPPAPPGQCQAIEPIPLEDTKKGATLTVAFRFDPLS